MRSGLCGLYMGSAIKLPAHRGARDKRHPSHHAEHTDGAEQAAQTISQAPSAGWSWQNQVIPFSGVPAWVMVGPAITPLLFTAFLHHEAGHKASPKRSPSENCRARNCYLNLEGSAQKRDEGTELLPTSPGNSPGWGQRGMKFPKRTILSPALSISFHPPSSAPTTPRASSRAGVYPHTPSSTHTLGWELFSHPERLVDSCAAKTCHS